MDALTSAPKGERERGLRVISRGRGRGGHWAVQKQPEKIKNGKIKQQLVSSRLVAFFTAMGRGESAVLQQDAHTRLLRSQLSASSSITATTI